MRSLGIRRALAAIVAYAVSALTPKVPRTPAITKFNEHPFAKRMYGKVVAGGTSLRDTIRGVIRGVLGVTRSVVAFLKPAAALAALLAVMLAINAGAADASAVLATGAVVTSKQLRTEKAALLKQARSALDASEAALRKVDEKADATAEDRESAKKEADHQREVARTFQVQASELDPRIEAVEQQEAAEAEMGRSQGRLAGGRDFDPADALGGGGVETSSLDDEVRSLSKEEREQAALRYVTALAAGRGDHGRIMAYAEKHFGADDLATRALSSSDVEDGAAIVPDSFSESIIERLTPMSAVRRMNPIVVPLPRGKLTLPKMTAGAVAGYIGENDNAPKTQQKFGDLVLTFRKLAAVIPISNDLLRFAVSQAMTVLRDDLGSALVEASDPKFIRGTGTEHAPKGFRHWAPASNVINANATVNLANVTEDLGKLVLALQEANVRMLRPGWIFAPRTAHYLMTVRDGNGNYAFRDEMREGRLWGWPFAITTNVPWTLGSGGDESEVYLTDFADVVLGEVPGIGIAASDTAAYHDGSSVQAAFSRDQTVLRAIQEHDLGMRHDESVAVLDRVTWGT